MNGSLLQKGTSKSDTNLQEQVNKTSRLSSKVALSWVSPYVLTNTLLAMVVSGSIYVLNHLASNAGVPTMGKNLHQITGTVLGFLLVARIVLGLNAVSEAAAKVQAFNKACRTLAVISSFVAETMTISAGAELEKKAVTKFRYELVRLLNLSVFTYHLMLEGKRIEVPPPALKGGKNEAEVCALVMLAWSKSRQFRCYHMCMWRNRSMGPACTALRCVSVRLALAPNSFPRQGLVLLCVHVPANKKGKGELLHTPRV